MDRNFGWAGLVFGTELYEAFVMYSIMRLSTHHDSEQRESLD